MSKDMKIHALIPARSGSKGIPKKNIVNLGGKPLIYWTIKASIESRYIERTFVSTDSNEIADISKKYGAEIPYIRPQDLSQDKTPTKDVIFYHLQYFRPDVLVLLQPTSPLRDKDHIDRAVELFLEKKPEAVISVKEASEKPFWMMEIDKDGFLKHLFKERFTRRQDMPSVYIPNGAIYIYDVKTLLKNKDLFPERTIPFIMDRISSIDIDDHTDLRIAEIFIGERYEK